MTEKRIVEETTCKHGNVKAHVIGKGIGATYTATECDGGSRRVLTEGQYVLIEKEDGEWPRDQVFAMFNQGCLCDTDEARSILDALSDHTEGTP